MRTFVKTSLGLVGLVVTGLLVGGAYVVSGSYDIGADSPHFRPVFWLANTVREHSVAAHARGIKAPPLNDPNMILVGAGQYAAMCSGCHLAPGFDSNETRDGLYPKPPKLYAGNLMSPARTFWVIKHGIKMSGMPAWGRSHDDHEMWAITAFVMQLPKLNAAQYRAIVAKAPPDDDMKQMPMPGGKPMASE
ncbi:c-type cytochrome [Lichenicoccus sp.]|uniref:c-type cytochrome n=1 Tax=Lichenicoccus sp. TaxID=2781899 RepID=UPI003D09BE20